MNKKIIAGIISVLSLFVLSGCSASSLYNMSGSRYLLRNLAIRNIHRRINEQSLKNAKDKIASSFDSSKTNKSGNYKELADSVYKPGTSPVINVNHDKSTLSTKSWKYEEIKYSNLDSLNRTGTATAYLSKRNLGQSEGRTAQTWDPTGWHNQPKYVNGKRVFPQNRGHLIAYTLSFNFNSNGKFDEGQSGSLNNPKNLATQSTFANQEPMQKDSEDLVRNALENNKKVVYRVTPVFKGSNLMSTGYWVQAKSTDGSLNFNRFIYNVQPGIKFNYATGQSVVDLSIDVPE